MRRALTFALLLTLSGASAASAAAPWSAPIAIGPSTQCAPAIAFGGSGAGLVSWSPSCVSGPRVTRLASTSGQVLATVPRVLARPPVVYGRDRTVLLRQRLLTPATDFKHDSRTRLDVAFGRTERERRQGANAGHDHQPRAPHVRRQPAGRSRGRLDRVPLPPRCERHVPERAPPAARRGAARRPGVPRAGHARRRRAQRRLRAARHRPGDRLRPAGRPRRRLQRSPRCAVAAARRARARAPRRPRLRGRRRGRPAPGLDRHRRRGHTDRRRLRRVGHAGTAASRPTGSTSSAPPTGPRPRRASAPRRCSTPAPRSPGRPAASRSASRPTARPRSRGRRPSASRVTYPVRVAIAAVANAFAPFTQLAPSGAVHDLATGPGGTTLVGVGRDRRQPGPGRADRRPIRPARAPSARPRPCPAPTTVARRGRVRPVTGRRHRLDGRDRGLAGIQWRIAARIAFRPRVLSPRAQPIRVVGTGPTSDI